MNKEYSNNRTLKADQLYIIKCYNDSELFIKVGITGTSIGRRYGGHGGNKTMPYQYDVIGQLIDNNGLMDVIKLEDFIYDEFKSCSHEPNIKFGGYLECYKFEYFDEICNFIRSFDYYNNELKTFI